jgi:hypothetical protein
MLVVGNKVKQERVYEGRVSGESVSINASMWSKRLLYELHLQPLLYCIESDQDIHLRSVVYILLVYNYFCPAEW